VVVPVLVLVAIGGYLIGIHRTSGAPATASSASSAQETRIASGPSVLLEYPTGWEPASTPPAIPGLSIARPLLLAPGGDAARAGLISGQFPPGGSSPLPSAFLALGLFLTGALVLGRNWPGGLYLVASPFLFTLMASALRQYPFHGRLLIFLVPMVHLLVAEGATSLARGGSLLVRGLAARLPDRAWIKIVLACAYALFVVLPAFLLYEPAVEVVWRYTIRKRYRESDSHGDLRADLLDYREHMQRKARGQ